MSYTGDLRDTGVLLAIAVVLGLGSLGMRAGVPWLAPPPAPAPASCSMDEGVQAWDPPAEPVVPRIPVDEVLTRIEQGDVTIVDARPGDAFSHSHIPGAISLPADEADAILERESVPIHPQHLVVTYCDGAGSDSEYLGQLLGDSAGCSRVRVLEGGFGAWLAAGAPVEARHSG